MDYIDLEWLDDGIDSQFIQDFTPEPATPTSTSNDFEIDNAENSAFFDLYLGNLNAYDHSTTSHSSSENLIEPLMVSGGVIPPADLLHNYPAASSPSSSSLSVQQQQQQQQQPLLSLADNHQLSAFQPLATTNPESNSACDADLDMYDVKQEPIDTVELLRVLNLRVAEMTAASRAAQAQSDKSVADIQMGSLAPAKEEAGADDKTDGEDSPIDPKKLTSKERRQLRNKISARNFRVRRKEYISTLESQVSLHQTEARDLREKLLASQIENEKLRAENTILRARATVDVGELRSSIQLTQLAPPSPPIEHHGDNNMAKSPNLTLVTALTSARSSSPPPSSLSPASSSSTMTKPNLNKDVSINGTRSGFTDISRVLVSSFELPEWDVEKILDEHRARREGLSEKAVAMPPVTKPTGSTLLASMFVRAVMEKLWFAFVQGLVNVPLDQMVEALFPAPATQEESICQPKSTYLDELFDTTPKDTIIITEPPIRTQALDLVFPADYPPSAQHELFDVNASPPTSAYFDWLYDTIVMAAVLVGSSQ